jgi:hypothetical protein
VVGRKPAGRDPVHSNLLSAEDERRRGCAEGAMPKGSLFSCGMSTVAAFVVACAAGSAVDSIHEVVPTSDATSPAAPTVSPTFDADASRPDGAPSGCTSAATDVVYVLSLDDHLYSFVPAARTFSDIGALGCNIKGDSGTPWSPNSMAVDREAVAWVNYVEQVGLSDSAGSIYRLSTKDGSCLGPAASMPDDWYRLGMSFATDTATNTDTLYVTNNDGADVGMGQLLATLDPTTQRLTTIGAFGGMQAQAAVELAGRSDGELYGLFTYVFRSEPPPSEISRLDRSTAAPKVPFALPAVIGAPRQFAFAFWGGRFYVFTQTDDQHTSSVAEYDPATGNVDTAYVPDAGFTIVGAGSSVCVPLEKPN